MMNSLLLYLIPLCAFFTAFICSLFLGYPFIKIGQKLLQAPVREYTPEGHQTKTGTPSMGGIIIICAALCALFLFNGIKKTETILIALSLTLFGAIGLWDDLSKLLYKKGISEKHKSRAQLLAAFIITVLWLFLLQPNQAVLVPFFSDLSVPVSLFIIPWVLLVLVGTSNAVNLTDGLDGLATSCLIPNYLLYTLLALTSSFFNPAVAVASAALAGSCTGFLWHNKYPARMFMGDVGSLALGAALATSALLLRLELLLPISGGLFVIETLSVILQVASFKLRKKKIFRMATLHHHYELLGMPEKKITLLFAGITSIFCIISWFLV